MFSQSQVARGKVSYESACASCHGIELVSIDSEIPSLSALDFRLGWKGRTLSERMIKISTTMPPGGLARLGPNDYVDIIAYILSRNGFVAGKQEMSADSADLERYVVDLDGNNGGQ